MTHSNSPSSSFRPAKGFEASLTRAFSDAEWDGYRSEALTLGRAIHSWREPGARATPGGFIGMLSGWVRRLSPLRAHLSSFSGVGDEFGEANYLRLHQAPTTAEAKLRGFSAHVIIPKHGSRGMSGFDIILRSESSPEFRHLTLALLCLAHTRAPGIARVARGPETETQWREAAVWASANLDGAPIFIPPGAPGHLPGMAQIALARSELSGVFENRAPAEPSIPIPSRARPRL